jgi:hypothetical protein
MHRIFLSSALAFCMVCVASAQDIAGNWEGTLKAGSGISQDPTHRQRK